MQHIETLRRWKAHSYSNFHWKSSHKSLYGANKLKIIWNTLNLPVSCREAKHLQFVHMFTSSVKNSCLKFLMHYLDTYIILNVLLKKLNFHPCFFLGTVSFIYPSIYCREIPRIFQKIWQTILKSLYLILKQVLFLKRSVNRFSIFFSVPV